jgi:2-C-methyl-D-erythritol 4-phosphate cytidylyltransferase
MFNGQNVGAVVTAAGKGERMGGINKVFSLLGGKEVLAHSVNVLEKCQYVDQIVIVLRDYDVERGEILRQQEGWFKVSDICPGGDKRAHSVKEGIKWLGNCGWVIIQDGARPMLNSQMVKDGLEAAAESGAAIAAVAVKDTIKQSDADGFVLATPPRETLYAAQTPQIFRADILEKAYQQEVIETTDDAALVEKLGVKIKLYAGSYDNIKITTPSDITIAEMIWQKRRL